MPSKKIKLALINALLKSYYNYNVHFYKYGDTYEFCSICNQLIKFNYYHILIYDPVETRDIVSIGVCEDCYKKEQ